MPRTIKKKYNKCFSSPPASFFEAASLFLLFVIGKVGKNKTNRRYCQHKLFCNPALQALLSFLKSN